MNGPAALLVLALAQQPEAAPPAAASPADTAAEQPPAAAERPVETAPAPRPPPEPAQPPPAQSGTAAPSAEPAAVPRGPAEPPEAAPSPRITETTPPPSRKPPAPRPPRPPGPPSAATPPAAPSPTAPAKPHPEPSEKAQVAAAALRFFQALLARHAADLAALSAPSFSFDGRVVHGQDQVRSRWFEAVFQHDGVAYTLYDLQVLPAAEAMARLGKPPKRVAGLVQPGSWVAFANLSGRPTFVFFARQGAVWVATGLHD